MNSGSPLGHEELLTLARKVEAAASDGDRGHLDSAAGRFLDALTHHLQAERVDLAELPSEDGTILVRRQQQLLDLAVELTAAARRLEPRQCESLASQLVATLGLTANDVRQSLGRVAPRPVPERSP
jgi:hypothetical protein